MSPNPLLTEAIERLAAGNSLGADEAAGVLREVMEGRGSEVQVAAFLVALRAKGETAQEVVGLARTMRELAVRVEVSRDGLLDTAGTGGGRPTFNVSTTAAFVAAGAGATVAKHGNRSATGSSGSADVLEALGARIDLEPAGVAECIESVGFGFMFAPRHHTATRHVVPVRRELGVPTVFNLLGPLTNPAGARRQLIGVSDPARLELMAAALAELGAERALVVSSEDGLDEVSVSGATSVVRMIGGEAQAFTIRPEDLGVDAAPADAFGPGSPEQNADIARRVLSGEPGPSRALTVVNAGAALCAAGRARSIEQGARRAEEAIDSGAARERLERYLEKTRELAPPT